MVTTHEWITQDELLTAFGTAPDDKKLEWFGVTRPQFNRWKRQTDIRLPVALARLIRYRQRFHLSELLGNEWNGFIAHGPALEFHGLNRALRVAELHSVWFNLQRISMLDARANRLQIERDRTHEAASAAE